MVLTACVLHDARADWMNLTGAETAPNIAEITIEEDRVRVVLEAYVGDFDVFEALIPDDLVRNANVDRPVPAERMRGFSEETLQIVTDTGETLQAELKLAEPRLRKDRFSPFAGMINPMTRQRVPEAPEDKRVLYAEIEYPFEGKPEAFTIIPPRNEDGTARVNIGFITYHEAVPVIDFRYLSGAFRLVMDWDDPWYTKFDNPNLKRHHQAALMSFLYVEPNEVRHEVLTRVKDLEAWMDLGLRDNRIIEPDEWAPLKRRVGEFMLSKNRVLIDGKDVKPVLDRVDFVTVGLKGVKVIEEPETLQMSAALLGVILTYVVDGIPQEVTADWELFTPQIQKVPATATDPAGPFQTYVMPDSPVHEWKNHLKTYVPPTIDPVPLGSSRMLRLPWASVALLFVSLGSMGLAFRPRFLERKAWIVAAVAGVAGAAVLWPVAGVEVDNPLAGPPTPEQTAETVERLAGNLHHAVTLRDNAKRQDAFSVSVHEPDLAAILPELSRALEIKVQGGGIARVDAIRDVSVRDIEPLDGGGFRAIVEWTADASAGHWGHLHRRRMQFNALMELVPVDGVWKLAGLTVITVQQES